jgi:uncharacterized membrane protein YdjX (TVP38/TMEM64 family)
VELRPRYNVKVAIILAWAFILVILVMLVGPSNLVNKYSDLNADDIRNFVLSFGTMAVIVFILINTFRPVIFLPITPFIIAGGFLFGFEYGMIYSFIGAVLSALLTFGFSRYVFRDYVKERIRGRFALWDKDIAHNGIMMIAVMRLIPIIPFDIVGYLAGASSVRFKDFMAGTIAGTMPGLVIFTLLGSSLVSSNLITLIVCIFLAVTMLGLPNLYKRLA